MRQNNDSDNGQLCHILLFLNRFTGRPATNCQLNIKKKKESDNVLILLLL